MPLETLRDVFRHQLGDAYHAEQQVLGLLDRIELETAATELRDRVRAHRAETLRQIENLERCFELVGASPPRVESELTRGLVAERDRFAALQPSHGALEAYNIHSMGRLAAMKREGYRQLCRLAQETRHDDARRLLEQNLGDEVALGEWIDEHAPALLRAAASAA